MSRTVSLRLPEKLKRTVERLADRRGQTPHAFMVQAIAIEAERAARWKEFLGEADEAQEEVRRTGTANAMEDVHRYIRGRLAGKRPRRPKPKPWP